MTLLVRSAMAFVASMLVATAAHADDSDRAAQVADVLIAALKSETPADGAATLGAPLRYRGLVFADKACAKRFAASGTIAKADLKRFAACLPSTEGLRHVMWSVGLTTDKPSTFRPDDLGIMDVTVDARTMKIVGLEHREALHGDALDDDEDGIEGSDGSGTAAPPPPAPPPPRPARLITQSELFRELRSGTASSVVPPDPDTRDRMRAAKRDHADMSVKVCFTPDGHGKHLEMLRRSDFHNWDVRVLRIIAQMTIGSSTETVCSELTFTTGPLDKPQG